MAYFVLTYHVLPEQVLSTDLKYFQKVKTLEGKEVFVYKDNSQGVRVTDSWGRHFNNVTAADNKASNGVVHIIDGVLMPPPQVMV